MENKTEKIEHIDIGGTEWEIGCMLEEYKPVLMAKVLDKTAEIVDVLQEIIKRIVEAELKKKDKLLAEMGEEAYKRGELERWSKLLKSELERLSKLLSEENEDH